MKTYKSICLLKQMIEPLLVINNCTDAITDSVA